MLIDKDLRDNSATWSRTLLRQNPVLITSVVSLSLILLISFNPLKNEKISANPVSATVRVSSSSTSDRECSYSFVKYIPSQFETLFYDRREELQKFPEKLCELLDANRNLAVDWIEKISRNDTKDDDIFSYFVYKNSCNSQTSRVYIEPLAANFRHPFVIPHCKPHIPDPYPQAHAESREYLFINGLTPSEFQLQYPGKRYFFDLGTSTFRTSLAWMMYRYGEKAVHFDEIWAWEAIKLDGDDYWREVPADFASRLHFYNIKASLEPTDMNVFHIIKRIAKPGDFVVVKLDIDNAPVENEFMRIIYTDNELLGLISEMMFEMHYDSPHVYQWFGTTGGENRWLDVMNLFSSLRSQGLRLHYWP